ncbi:MAG TPA: flagellar FlbD family protein [Bryobacteraceae bacterium]|nr:flagellar FlbD family protein [Bryobacteraceae bacterium]
MIHLTRLNRIPLVVNSDLIEHIDVTPDTLIVLTSGQKILVLETAEEVVERVIDFRRALLGGMSICPHSTLEAAVAQARLSLAQANAAEEKHG